MRNLKRYGRKGQRAAERRALAETMSHIDEELAFAKGPCIICGTFGCKPTKLELDKIKELEDAGLSREKAISIVSSQQMRPA